MKKKAAAAPAVKRNVYQVITDLIVDQLNAGVVAWRKPWTSGAAGVWPINYATKRAYGGFNAFYLNFVAAGRAPFFMTYKQAQQAGGQVRAGQKGTMIVFFRPAERAKNTEGQPAGQQEKEQRGTLQYFTVFHYSQIDGIEFEIPAPVEPAEVQVIEQAEQLVSGYENCPSIQSMSQNAFYSGRMDFVNMPKRESFESAEKYYATLFHELVHSTGHQSRLSRVGIVEFDRFGSEQYAKEELIAEMGASFLCGFAGIDPGIIGHNAAYIANWLKALKNDPKLVISAASQAEKAVRYMMGQPKEEVATQDN